MIMSEVIKELERRQLKKVPRFLPGDSVKVHFQVQEGRRTRTQVFEGVVMKRQGSGVRETFTVRKTSFGVGVERTFPVHSPKIERIDIDSRGEVRRSKLYYLRGRIGRKARVREQFDADLEAEMSQYESELMEQDEEKGPDQADDENKEVADSEQPAEQAEVQQPAEAGASEPESPDKTDNAQTSEGNGEQSENPETEPDTASQEDRGD